jgi:hypothetical protein
MVFDKDDLILEKVCFMNKTRIKLNLMNWC